MKTSISALIATASLVAMAPVKAEDAFSYRHATSAPAYGFQTAVVRQHPLAGLREINLRQDEQRARIDGGFRRGVITRWEFRRLMTEQQEIKSMERAFVADGFLSPHERMELNRRLDIASQHIVVESHDRQRRL